jgi:hypothetical protein
MIKSTTGSGDGAPLSIGAPMEEYYFTRTFERKVRFCFYQGMCKRRLWKRAALSIGAPLGNLWGAFAGDSERQMK